MGGGVEIFGRVSKNLVEGNYIGTDVTGDKAIGNDFGVIVFGFNVNKTASSALIIAAPTDNTIGGTAKGAGNIIAGNLNDGVVLYAGGGQKEQVTDKTIQPGLTDNLVAGNSIGVAANGAALGNGSKGDFAFTDPSSDGLSVDVPAGGVVITSSSDNTVSSNTIAFNDGPGVLIPAAFSSTEVKFESVGNQILGNSIHDNAKLGINLVSKTDNSAGVTPNDTGDGDTGPNNLQNYPVLSGAASPGDLTIVGGTLNSAAKSKFTIQFFASPKADPSGFGEGQTLLGSLSVTTDSSGNANFVDSLLPAVQAGEVITATATDSAGDTSEFSKAVALSSAFDSAGNTLVIAGTSSADALSLILKNHQVNVTLNKKTSLFARRRFPRSIFSWEMEMTR